MTENKRILSGIQPSGTLHLGNYFGMMKPAIDMQAHNDCFYFIADYHAMTQLPDPEALRDRVWNVAVDFLACGLDPGRTTFFRQSDVPEVTELTWILSCLTPLGILERCHSYKDKITRGLKPNHGLFSYPVLMASDILIYDSQVVPVGRDQKQHVEVTRDLAMRFNNQYEETFVIPDSMIRENVAAVPGTDGQKMSKSYGNTIDIFGPEKQMRQKIMRIVTDSKPVEAPKDPDSCNVFKLYCLFADEHEAEGLRERYREGGMGYGEAKQMLYDKYVDYFRAARARRGELLENPDAVETTLQDGAAKAREVAREKLDNVKRVIGLQ